MKQLNSKTILMLADIDLGLDDACKAHFLNLARGFGRQGLGVIVVVPAGHRSAKTISCSAYSDNLEMIEVPFFVSPVKLLNTFSKYLGQLPAIVRIIRKRRPRFIYARITHWMFIPLIWLKILRSFRIIPYVRLVGEVNGWAPEEMRMGGASAAKVFIEKRLFKLSVKYFDILRAVTADLKTLLSLEFKVPAVKIFVAGNGTDTDFFRPLNKTEAKRKVGINFDCPVIGFIGNLAKWQGVDFLIDAAPSILKKLPKVRFLIGGNGPESDHLKNQAQRLGVADRFVFAGQVPYEEAPIFINAFDAGVVLKRDLKSGLSPLKVYDYAACGVPVVASRARGLEIIEKFNFGRLADATNSEILAEVLVSLLSDKNRLEEIGRRGREAAEKNFSWQKVVSTILNESK